MRGLRSNVVLLLIWERRLISLGTLQESLKRWDLRESIQARGHEPSAHPSQIQSLCSRVKILMMIGSSLRRICATAAIHLLKSVTVLLLISRAACRKIVVWSNVMALSPPILFRDWIRMHPAPPATSIKTQASLSNLIPLSHNRVRIAQTNLKRLLYKLHITLIQATVTTCRALRLHPKIKNSLK